MSRNRTWVDAPAKAQRVLVTWRECWALPVPTSGNLNWVTAARETRNTWPRYAPSCHSRPKYILSTGPGPLTNNHISFSIYKFCCKNRSVEKDLFNKIIIYISFYLNLDPVMSRTFGNGPGDQGSIPGRVIPKTQKMVPDAPLLNTQHYKVKIKGKVEQSRERISVLLYTSVW